MTQYIVNVVDNYATPVGALTKEQYVEFVMNKAAESYQSQYSTATTDAGIQAACDAYNAALPAAQE